MNSAPPTRPAIQSVGRGCAVTPEEQLAAWCAALSTPLAVRLLTDVEVSGPYSVSELMARLGASREVVRRATVGRRPCAAHPAARSVTPGYRWLRWRRSMPPWSHSSPVGPLGSRLVYGTWRLLDDPQYSDTATIRDLLQACVDVGVTTVDTAAVYGRYEVEAALGAALRASPGLRSRIHLVTKCGILAPSARHPDVQRAHYDARARELTRSVEASLRNLGVEVIDLLLVHRPDWLTSADETATGLLQLMADGKILAAGVSNFSVHEFDLLDTRLREGGARLATNQVQMSLLHTAPLWDGTLAQCERARVLPMLWSPLAGGRLLDSGDLVARRVRTTCEEMAPRYGGATPEQLALAWLLALPSRPAVVFGTKRVERITSAAAARDIQLARADWYSLWEAAHGRGVP